LGRIRCGEQVANANGDGTHPTALDTFRITSPNRDTIEAAAMEWGGNVVASPTLAGQFEVVTETSVLDVIVPPSDMAFTQAFEQWGRGGFCTARCDGVWDVVNDKACWCNPENPKCKIHSRLSVMVPALPGIGVWRVETQGFYASSELAATIEVMQAMVGRNLVAAQLRLDAREQRTIRDGKPETRKFVVVNLNIPSTLAEIGSATVGIGAGGGRASAGPDDAGSLEPPRGHLSPASTPPAPSSPAAAGATGITIGKPSYRGMVDQRQLPPSPLVSVEDQMAEVHRGPKAKRKGVGAIAPTGIEPRPAADVDPQVCTICGQPYGTAPLKRNKGQGSKFVHATCAEGMEEPADENNVAKEPAPPAERSPVSQGERKGGRGGTDGGQRSTPQPTPAAGPLPRAASVGQRKAMMATIARVAPRHDNETTEALDQRRKSLMLDLAGICGQPGLASRTDISARTAGRLLDLFAAIETGELAWDDDTGNLLVVETGEVVETYEGRT